MVKYFPKKRMIINRKTLGGEFIKDGKPYTGAYWLDYQGKPFPGANPLVSDNIPLERIPESINPIRITQVLYSDATIAEYLEARQLKIEDLTEYIDPVPEYPQPTEVEYQRGYFTRYFARKIGSPFTIIEITKPVYESIERKKSLYSITLNTL